MQATTFDPVAVFRTEGDRMADVPADSFAAAVPTCGSWDVADLLSHTGWVHRLMRHMLCLPEGERPTRESRTAAGLPEIGSAQHPDGDLLRWFRAGVQDLELALRTTPPTKQLNSLFGLHHPSFLARRVAHETAMHRWDLENALGSPRGFDAAVASDGVDELLDVWVPRRFDHGAFAGRGQTIQLRATDGDAGWVVVVEPDTTRWWRGREETGDVTARGTLDDLYLFIWNRCPADRLEVSGDSGLLTRWQAAAAV